MNEPHGEHQPEQPAPARKLHPSEIPTLPLPSTWRLVLGGIVILAFLIVMYRTYTPDEPPADPAKSSLEQGTA